MNDKIITSTLNRAKKLPSINNLKIFGFQHYNYGYFEELHQLSKTRFRNGQACAKGASPRYLNLSCGDWNTIFLDNLIKIYIMPIINNIFWIIAINFKSNRLVRCVRYYFDSSSIIFNVISIWINRVGFSLRYNILDNFLIYNIPHIGTLDRGSYICGSVLYVVFSLLKIWDTQKIGVLLEDMTWIKLMVI